MTHLASKWVKCHDCDGFGVYDAGYHNPRECDTCSGSGQVFQYPSGALAKYPGGAFIGNVTTQAGEDNG